MRHGDTLATRVTPDGPYLDNKVPSCGVATLDVLISDGCHRLPMAVVGSDSMTTWETSGNQALSASG